MYANMDDTEDDDLNNRNYFHELSCNLSCHTFSSAKYISHKMMNVRLTGYQNVTLKYR